MTLEPYTSTYQDVADSIVDAEDLVAEFWRVSYFINLWAGSIVAIGQEDDFTVYIEIVEGELAEIIPSNGLIQRFEVAADVEEFTLEVKKRVDGDPFRVYATIRCLSADTRFVLSVPGGEAHVFGLNHAPLDPVQRYRPSQVITDGFFTSTVIMTYGSEEGVMVQVHGANPEESEVNYDDVLTAVPK